MDDKTTVYDYLRSNKYMTLATASTDGKPEAATVEYVMDGDDLIINTFVYYRKYKNLVANPVVACVVTTAHEKTLQFEGKISELDGQAAAEAKQKMLMVEPDFANFFDDTDTRFFKITPCWMRLRDYTAQPLNVTEYMPESDAE